MSIIQGNAKQGSTRGFYSFPIEQSLRFNSADSTYLAQNFATTGTSNTTQTFSLWVKRSKLGVAQGVFGAYASGLYANSLDCIFTASDTLTFQLGGSSAYTITTTQVFRDVSAWYHIVIAVDTTQATNSNRVKIYVNGEQITSFSAAAYPALNAESLFGLITGAVSGSNNQNIGAQGFNFVNKFDGYLAEVNFIDGTAYDADDFGELKNGVWIPKDPTGLTYGTNGFHLTFADDAEVEAFNTVLYRGNNNNGQSVTGMGFQPDLVWIKQRTTAVGHNIEDSVRGAGKFLQSETTAAEDPTGNLISFDSDGFTVGTGNRVDQGTNSYVAWGWKAGGSSNTYNVDGTGYASMTAAGLTDGSVAVTGLSVSTTYGFSISTFNSGSSGTQSFAHGLGTTPSLCIFKERNSGGAGDHWVVWEGMTGNPATSYGYLNLTNAFGTDASQWSNTAPTSTMFTFNSGYAWSTSQDMIAYCWAEKAGYSKFGSYSGSASAITESLGFKPAFVMIKRTDSDPGDSYWLMFDNTRNVTGDKFTIYANLSAAESTDTTRTITFDETNQTFTVPASGTADRSLNITGGTYIYAAFADTREAAFWLDQSGNDNHWQPVNLDHNDTVADSPTNNYATINPLTVRPQNTSTNLLTISDGNLQVNSTQTAWRTASSSIAMNSGKWYFEGKETAFATNHYLMFGITPTSFTNIGHGGQVQNGYMYYAVNGRLYYSQTNITYGATYGLGDLIGIAFDADNGTLEFYKNGTSQGQITGIPAGDYYFSVSEYGTATEANVNFGQHGFEQTPPTGYNALITQNLSIAEGIDPAQDKHPDDQFGIILYTGTGATHNEASLDFTPDMTIVKSRSNARNWTMYDQVRDYDYFVYPNLTNAEGGPTNYVQRITNGIQLNGSDTNTNASGYTYAAWNWKANGSGVSNNVGSIPSTVSANTESGFSILTWTGNGTADSTLGHGLDSAPEMMIVKETSGANGWAVYHKALGSSKEVYLNYTQGQTSSNFWRSTPTSTTFAVSSSNYVNENGTDYVGYCFHSVEGFSKFGSYVGSGNADGPFVYTGFRPAFVLWKRSDASQEWHIMDVERNIYNPLGKDLWPPHSSAEYDYGTVVDYTSNGFKFRTNSVIANTVGGTYIYMAFAENPFKYSNAR